ncbi:carboxypeptidase regulatory-like domain-containing protein, partial [bacterium]|nr:carboxypeptidase regulatory-like domain-containing protein [bacterium]
MKSKRLNCCFTLIVIISTITLILSTKPIWADQMVGHSTEKIADQNNSSRTITLSPFAPPGEISEITHHGWGFPGRDDGSGELVWSSFDEDGISGKVDISADGQTVAIGYTLNGERLEVRNGADGEILFTYEVEDGGSWVSVSGDGRLIAYSDRDAIRMFERNGEGDPIFEFSENDLIPSRVSISNSGDYLIATGIDPNIETNVIWGFIIGEDEPAWVLEVDAEESYGWYGISIAEEGGIVAVNGKYHLYVIDLISGDLIWDEPTYNSESGVSLSEDGTILTIGSLSGRLRVFGWDVEDEIYFELWHYGFTGVPSNWITAVAVSPDGNFTAAGTLDFLENGYQGRLAVFDNFGNGEPIWITDPLGDEISDIQFNLDGTILAASSWGDIENETPDLVIHETHNPEPFFRLVSPGALSAVAISSDGSRIVASGKSVHNRVFGRGGRVYMVETTISGGEISGVISDSNGDPIEGAVVEIEQENPYSALSDQNGEYTLRVEFDGDERQVEVTASGPGFINSSREINVRQNQVIEDVDFALDEADAAPQNLAASQGVRNVIRIQWDAYNEANAIENVAKKRILTATGNI